MATDWKDWKHCPHCGRMMLRTAKTCGAWCKWEELVVKAAKKEAS
jgi:hypothetical protein